MSIRVLRELLAIIERTVPESTRSRLLVEMTVWALINFDLDGSEIPPMPASRKLSKSKQSN